jgi:hypothetical protein
MQKIVDGVVVDMTAEESAGREVEINAAAAVDLPLPSPPAHPRPPHSPDASSCDV